MPLLHKVKFYKQLQISANYLLNNLFWALLISKGIYDDCMKTVFSPLCTDNIHSEFVHGC